MPREGGYETLAQLRAFAAFAHCGSISEASEALRLTAAAVRKSIHTLELVWGVALTTAAPLGLTDAGRLLCPYVDRVLTADGILRRVAGTAEGFEQLRISCYSVHLEAGLIDRIATFVEERAVRLHLQEVAPEDSADRERQLFEPLEQGGIDLAVGGGALDRFDSKLLYRTRVVAVLNDDAPLRDHSTIDLEGMRGPLLVLGPGFFSRDRIDHALSDPALGHLHIAHELPTARALVKLGEKGFGTPLVADDAIDAPEGRPFPAVLHRGEPLEHEVCIHRRKGGGPSVVDEFWESITAVGVGGRMA